jgi:hypothetical protein
MAVKTDLLTKQLGTNGLLGLVAIFATVIVFLYFTTQKVSKDRILDKDIQLEKTEKRVDKTDSLNHILLELRGAKKVIDTLNK